MKGVIINQTSFRMKGNVFVSGLTAFIILILCVRLFGHQGMLFLFFVLFIFSSAAPQRTAYVKYHPRWQPF